MSPETACGMVESRTVCAMAPSVELSDAGASDYPQWSSQYEDPYSGYIPSTSQPQLPPAAFAAPAPSFLLGQNVAPIFPWHPAALRPPAQPQPSFATATPPLMAYQPTQPGLARGPQSLWPPAMAATTTGHVNYAAFNPAMNPHLRGSTQTYNNAPPPPSRPRKILTISAPPSAQTNQPTTSSSARCPTNTRSTITLNVTTIPTAAGFSTEAVRTAREAEQLRKKMDRMMLTTTGPVDSMQPTPQPSCAPSTAKANGQPSTSADSPAVRLATDRSMSPDVSSVDTLPSLPAGLASSAAAGHVAVQPDRRPLETVCVNLNLSKDEPTAHASRVIVSQPVPPPPAVSALSTTECRVQLQSRQSDESASVVCREDVQAAVSVSIREPTPVEVAPVSGSVASSRQSTTDDAVPSPAAGTNDSQQPSSSSWATVARKKSSSQAPVQLTVLKRSRAAAVVRNRCRTTTTDNNAHPPIAAAALAEDDDRLDAVDQPPSTAASSVSTAESVEQSDASAAGVANVEAQQDRDLLQMGLLRFSDILDQGFFSRLTIPYESVTERLDMMLDDLGAG